MNEQLDRIKNKLEQLRILDKDLELFGADIHEYLLNPVLTSEDAPKKLKRYLKCQTSNLHFF